MRILLLRKFKSETTQITNYCDMHIQYILPLSKFFFTDWTYSKTKREQDVEINTFTNVAVSQPSQHCQTQWVYFFSPHTIQYKTIQYNTIQYNTIQYNTIQYNTIQYNTIQYNTIQYNTIQYNTIQYNTIQYNTIQNNTTQHNTTQHNTTQHNTTQHNTIQYNTIQYNTIQYNTIQALASVLCSMEIMEILYVCPMLYSISLNNVLRILGCQDTKIVTASKIWFYIHTMHLYFSINQFYFCKALN